MIRLLDCVDESLLIDEAYEYVIRNRKKVRRLKKRPGYKVVKGKYVKMSGREKMKRKLAQRKGAKKRKAKRAQISRKRRLSLQKRRSTGLRRR